MQLENKFCWIKDQAIDLYKQLFLSGITWDLAVIFRLIKIYKVTKLLIYSVLQYKPEKLESGTWEKKNRNSLVESSAK